MTESTNRLGVNFVEAACLKQQWFFREQTVSDQGIDAHAEKAPQDMGTGRLVAIQIKSGESYFKKPTDDGWIFRFDAKKAKLWLGHALPVLVVLVDVNRGIGYWQQISTRTVVPTGKGFKVVVPRAQILTQADEEWAHIASGLESRAAVTYELALTQLPPSVRRLVENRAPHEHLDSAVLASHLAEGRSNPRGTTQSLLATSPGWIERQGARAWQTVACYAAEHDELDLSAQAFERAAATAEIPGRFLVAAALNVMGSDRPRAEALLGRVEELDDVPLSTAVLRTLLAHPPEDAGPRGIPQILRADTPEIRANQAVQTLLSDEATRTGDLDPACTHARFALDADPDNSSSMIFLAEALLRRSQTPRRHVDDVPNAIEVLERAMQQRRSWSGRTLPVLQPLLQAYALNGQFEAMLSRCLPSPDGTATVQEAEHPHIRRSALAAALFARRTDLTAELAARLGDSVQDRIARLRAGVLDLTSADQIALWQNELDRALAEDDYHAVAAAGVSLASLGIDDRPRLASLVERSILPAELVDLMGALIAAKDDLDAGLPALRSLARRDLVAAEYLVRKLTAAQRHIEAAQACSALYEHTSNPDFLIQRAHCLIESREDTAESAAIAAVNATAAFPTERAALYTFLAGTAADRGEWDVAEKHLLQSVLLTAKPSATTVWNLALTQVNQGKLQRASTTLAQYRPSVTHRDQAALWLRANAMAQWDEAMASEALTLARRFDDPQLSAALLGHIVTMTHGVDDQPPMTTDDDPADDANLDQRRRMVQRTVPGELHRQAFAAIQELVSDFGDKTGIKILQGEPDKLLEQVATMTKQTNAAASALTDVITAARDGLIPRGLIADLVGRSLTTILVQRGLGPLVSGAADDNEHDLDVQSAAAALAKPVIVDTATLLVLTGMRSSGLLEGQFTSLSVSVGTMWDIHRATFDARGLAGSPGTLGWNAQLDSLSFWELDDNEFTRRLRRAQALEDFAQNLATRTVQDLTLFSDLADMSKNATWLEPIQLAHDQGVALWSDDLGLRRLARQKGVPCFGTPALIDTLRDRALENAFSKDAQAAVLLQTAESNQELARDMIVDVALHLDDLVQIAKLDDWLPQAGGLVLSRASWWAWQAEPIQDLLILYTRIASHKPESLPDWQYAAMLGAGRAFQPATTAAKMLATFALLGYGSEPTTDEAIEAMRRARRAADDLGLPDPLAQLPAAASSLARVGRFTDPATVVNTILARIDE